MSENIMTPAQQQRALLLLKVGAELSRKADDSSFIKSFMMQTAIWDGVECDGGCWTEEAESLVDEVSA